ncbi:uncharacterized protein [Notamacropus eugenii]|uniref:uncharacterized protein n=1 Tax=Notamacropus eugenii TaxID=9315 RepID=UPI003B679B78
MNRKKQTKSEKTIESFYGDKDQNTNTKEVRAETVLPSETSDGNMNFSQAQLDYLERLKKDIKEKLANDFKTIKKEFTDENINLKKKIEEMEKEVQKLTGENNSLKGRVNQTEKETQNLIGKIDQMEKETQNLTGKIGRMEKEVQKLNGENSSLKGKIGQMEKEMRKLTEENNTIKIRIGQVETNDSMRQQESVKQNLKNEKMEENLKYLIGKTTDLENRSRRENLRIIGLPETHDEEKSLDNIFQEIIKENCPEVLDSEGKIVIERIHRSPPERDPKLKTPRNIVAKFQSYQVKEKILQAARKKQFKYQGHTVRITQDLAASTLKDRKNWNPIFCKAKELGLQPRINYPAKFSITFQARRKSFNEIRDFQSFLTKTPELNRQFDLQMQVSRES